MTLTSKQCCGFLLKKKPFNFIWQSFPCPPRMWVCLGAGASLPRTLSVFLVVHPFAFIDVGVGILEDACSSTHKPDQVC